MIDREHQLSVARQAKLLDISRGAVYYPPRPISDVDLALMRRIDELHLEYPLWALACSGACCCVRASVWAGATWAR